MPAGKGVKGRRKTSFFRVTCKDNGRGMPHDDIPNMLGRVLSGMKYGLKQTRGKFGLGAKMTLIWSKMSTGLPIDILLVTRGKNYTSFCRLDIDIHKNVPHVHLHEKHDNKDRWHGAEIQVIIEGNWTTHHSKIIHYIRQMAVITPYAQFLFRYTSGKAADTCIQRNLMCNILNSKEEAHTFKRNACYLKGCTCIVKGFVASNRRRLAFKKGYLAIITNSELSAKHSERMTHARTMGNIGKSMHGRQ